MSWRAYGYGGYGGATSAVLASGYTSLGSIPIVAAGSGGVTQVLAPVPASWWCLDPADWPAAPAGRTLQYRLMVTFSASIPAQSLGARLYDTDAGAPMFAEVVKVSTTNDTTSVASGWQTFPVSAKSGYLEARNATSDDDTTVPAACIQVRIA